MEKRPDPDWHFNYWANRMETMLRNYLRDVQLVPQEQRFHSMFEKFMEDDIAQVERIFEHVQLGNTAQSRAQLEAYMGAHKRGANGRLVFDIRRDFGVDPAQVRDRFAFYMNSLSVTVETQ